MAEGRWTRITEAQSRLAERERQIEEVMARPEAMTRTSGGTVPQLPTSGDHLARASDMTVEGSEVYKGQLSSLQVSTRPCEM